MNWPLRRGRPVEPPTSPPGEWSSGAPALCVRIPRLALAFLGVLLGVYSIELGFRFYPATQTPADPTVGVLLPPQEDLGWVRASPSVPVRVSPFRFTDIVRQAGIDFVHVSGTTEAKHFPTAYGSGVATFDFDNDGKLDLYFATTTFLSPGQANCATNRLYRNLGRNRFEDATKTSGLGFAGSCHGIVVGDIDNDGDQDVFLCNYGSNVLYVNNGNGTFQDIR